MRAGRTRHCVTVAATRQSLQPQHTASCLVPTDHVAYINDTTTQPASASQRRRYDAPFFTRAQKVGHVSQLNLPHGTEK